jgi:hypothetical protein
MSFRAFLPATSFVLVLVGCGGASEESPGQRGTELSSACEAGFAHPIRCTRGRESLATMGDHFAACPTGWESTVATDTCCPLEGSAPCVVRGGATSGPPKQPTASDSVCNGLPEASCAAERTVCRVDRDASGVYVGCVAR